MTAYIIRRLILMIPTLFGIMVLNFAVVQFAPGGPIEQLIAQLTGAVSRIGGAGAAEIGEIGIGAKADAYTYRSARGLDPDFIRQIEKQFGFDRPIHERFLLMMKNYVRLDFGSSYFRDESVVSLVIEKMPVSISLGVWTTFIVYLISIPLGIRKAVRDGSPFDVWTSAVIIVGYAIPSFLFAVFLVVHFAGGSFLDIFPLRGLVSDNWAELAVEDC